MDEKPTLFPSGSPSVKSDLGSLHLKLITKLALLTSFAAIGLLILMVINVAAEAEGDYFQIIQIHTLTRQHIGPAMVVTTLLLLAMVGLSVSIITLYSSFRIAGPLYRFSRIFQQARQPVPAQHLRRKDSLQDVSHEIQESIQHLHAHYDLIQNEVVALKKTLGSKISTPEQYQKKVQRLKQLESELQLHE